MVAFNRVVIAGTLANGAEAWSTSCGFFDPVTGPVSLPADLTTWATDIATYLAGVTVPAELLTGLSTAGAITEVRVYFYAATGVPASAVGIATLSKTGTGTPSRPTTVAACLSLATGLAGRRYRGRMYWPALSNTIQVTGRFSSTVTAALAGAGSTLLTQIGLEAPGTATMVPVVVSEAGAMVTEVTSVRVGDVPDTQRSRRDGLAEVYAVAVV